MKKNIIAGAVSLALAGTLLLGAVPLDANEIILETPPSGWESLTSQAKEGYTVFDKTEGTIQLIHETSEGQPVLRIGEDADFFIDKDTVIVNETGLADISEAKEGMTATAYYIKPEMMTMIYPAQYTAWFIVLRPEKDHDRASVGFYTMTDGGLLNSEGDMYLNISENTKVLTIKGDPYTGSLDQVALAAFYDIVAMSFPGQATPDTVIVHRLVPKTQPAAEDVPPQPADTGEGEVMDKIDPELFDEMIIMVNTVLLGGEKVHRDDGGNILFPLRAVAEALDYPVKWDGELGRVTLGVAITLEIGNGEYTMGRMVPQAMDTPPVLVDGSVYVSGDFITNALGAVIDISQGYYNIIVSE